MQQGPSSIATGPAAEAPLAHPGRRLAHPGRRLTDRQRGIAFIEVIIALAIFAVLLNAVGIVIQKSFTSVATTADIEDTAARVLRKVVTELQDATLSSINLNSTKDTVVYSAIGGFSGSSPVLTGHKIAFDTGRIIQDDTTVIADEVSGLSFDLSGSTLMVTVMISRTQTVNGKVETVSRQMSGTIKL